MIRVCRVDCDGSKPMRMRSQISPSHTIVIRTVQKCLIRVEWPLRIGLRNTVDTVRCARGELQTFDRTLNLREFSPAHSIVRTEERLGQLLGRENRDAQEDLSGIAGVDC